VSANSTTPLDGTGTVVVTCTSGAPAAVTLGQGALAEPGVTQ
jgi:spore coat protein U-like protein